MPGIARAANIGSALLMVLVIVAMLVVMFTASIGVISRELAVTSDAGQKERVYRVADSGIQYILFLVGKAGKDTAYLLEQDGEERIVKDPVTEEEIGEYTLSVSPLPSPLVGVIVSSMADSPDGRFCANVTAKIEDVPEGWEGQYRVSGWTRSSCP